MPPRSTNAPYSVILFHDAPCAVEPGERLHQFAALGVLFLLQKIARRLTTTLPRRRFRLGDVNLEPCPARASRFAVGRRSYCEKREERRTPTSTTTPTNVDQLLPVSVDLFILHRALPRCGGENFLIRDDNASSSRRCAALGWVAFRSGSSQLRCRNQAFPILFFFFLFFFFFFIAWLSYVLLINRSAQTAIRKTALTNALLWKKAQLTPAKLSSRFCARKKALLQPAASAGDGRACATTPKAMSATKVRRCNNCARQTSRDSKFHNKRWNIFAPIEIVILHSRESE